MEPIFLSNFNILGKSISSISFHPKRKQILISSRSSGIFLYTIGRQSRPFIFEETFSPIRSTFSPDGSLIYGASTEGKIGLWRMHNSNPSIVKMAHQSKINDMDKWNENGYLITCSNDKSIKIWNSKLDFLTSISSHNSHVTTCRCNQRADIIISGEENGTVNLWDVHDTKSSIWSQSFCIKSRNSISSVDFDSTGTLFCVSTHDGELSVWDIRSLDDSPKVIQKYDVKSSCARFQPKNPFILTIGSDNIPCIYDLRAKSLLYSFEGHKRVCCACGWSVDGEMFATADIDGVVLLWEMPKKKKKNPFETFEITSVEPYHPPEINLTPELLMSQLDLITKIANKLNEKLDEQEKRIAKLAESYPEIGGFEYYDC